MKQLNVLPLVAIISGLMVGCGGGGGGGGGGGSTKTQLNFSFVKAETLSSQTSCKVFERTYEEVENGNLTDVNMSVLTASPIENALDSQLSIVISDDKGQLDTDSQKFVTNGKVSFYLEDIPQGGYLTVREQVGFDLYATSFSREFLEQNKSSLKNIMLTAVTPIPSLSCITGSSATVINKKGLQYRNSEDIPSDDAAVLPYYFISGIETETSNNPVTTSSTDFQALSSDITMIAQYRNSSKESLFQYAFEDWKSSGFEMRYTGNDAFITRNSSLKYGEVEIGVSYKDKVKKLSMISVGNDKYYRPDSLSLNERWFATSQANVISDSDEWIAKLNVPLDDAWELSLDESDLFNVSTVSTAKPTLDNTTNKALVIELSNNINISDSDHGIQRVALKPNRDAVDTQLHVVYSLPSDKIIVPNIEQIDASQLSFFEIQQDFWFTHSDKHLDARYVMDMFDATSLSSVDKDGHGILLEENVREKTISESSKISSLHLVR
ncbi:hypothetical protein [Vibrio alfacsensis]|uniref:hypothetical protein n=1 Tax=Vibrio alfacsensis TaxID=1074311 RepID=UPI004067CB0A